MPHHRVPIGTWKNKPVCLPPDRFPRRTQHLVQLGLSLPLWCHSPLLPSLSPAGSADRALHGPPHSLWAVALAGAPLLTFRWPVKTRQQEHFTHPRPLSWGHLCTRPIRSRQQSLSAMLPVTSRASRRVRCERCFQNIQTKTLHSHKSCMHLTQKDKKLQK